MMFAIIPVSLLLCIATCLFLYKVIHGKNSQNYPPGPKPLPLIGNLHTLGLRKPYLKLMELSKTYGSVFSVHIGSERAVVLCGYDTVKDALVNHADEFAERPRIPIIEQTSKGYGIIFSHGENWRVMRRFTLSTLRDLGMGKRSLEDRINEECDYLVETLKSYKGEPFENKVIMNAAVANIIVSMLTGDRFDYQDPTLSKLILSLNENIKRLSSPIVMMYNLFPSIMKWLPGPHNSISANRSHLYKFVMEAYRKHKDCLDVNDQKDLIDIFLVKQQEEKKSSPSYYHNDNLRELVANLFNAGMETTSTTLRWGLALMMKYPEIQKKVQNEIDKVIGSAQPQTEHRKQMPYTDAVIHEIQRFADLVPNNGLRATTKDLTFRGYFIPKGTRVIPLLCSVLWDKKYFEKPREFYPEHFLDSKGSFRKNEAFLPFSAGRRSCAGETLAKMELFLFFTRLLQNFTFYPPPGTDVNLSSTDGGISAPLQQEICAVSRM
ncbi:hypothetical protein GDO86_010534 [Hymenochirus boettgeri]|uniref:Cytochrome P450 2K1-like n=1 Tax=Hymenochirus boettgeri TaxID=247094 RepID=A0A8T2JTF5_9PIPI|nr:hypothetical protein GDO86_010534 [Hymenochirus boettgeri]